MSMFDIQLTPDGGGETLDIEVGMRDLVMWERTHKGRAFVQVEALSAQMLYEIAYSACRRQKLAPAEIPEASFFETYELEVEEPGARTARLLAAGPPAEPDDADPTRPGLSPGA